MDTVTRALTPEEIARVEARQQIEAEAAKRAAIAPPAFVPNENRPRTISVPLDFEVTYDGKVINEVVIRRPTMREWRAYLRACADAVAKDGPGADDAVDQVWISVPAIVLENLDFIDGARVEAAQDGFFERSPSPAGTGEGTSNSTSGTGEA